jgi:hypothetical protein
MSGTALVNAIGPVQHDDFVSVPHSALQFENPNGS